MKRMKGDERNEGEIGMKEDKKDERRRGSKKDEME